MPPLHCWFPGSAGGSPASSGKNAAPTDPLSTLLEAALLPPLHFERCQQKRPGNWDCQVSMFCFWTPLVGGCFAFAVALDKSVYATFGVNDFLLSGVERMAGAANFYTDVRFGGAGEYFSATHARSFDFLIFRMNALFHIYISTRFLGPERETWSLAVNPDNMRVQN